MRDKGKKKREKNTVNKAYVVQQGNGIWKQGSLPHYVKSTT